MAANATATAPIHGEVSPLAGKRVRLVNEFNHLQFPFCREVEVLDWHDRESGSWMFKPGNPACIIYGMRIGSAPYHVPIDNEVLYCKYEGLGLLVHASEIAEVLEGSNG